MNKFIIDGHNLAFRSHFAFRELKTSSGLISGCIYGVLNIMKSLKVRFMDSDFIIVWDVEAKRKKKIYADYKANRIPFDFDSPILDLKNMFYHVNVTQAYCEGEEADDVIGTLASQYAKDGMVYIYSNDKDLMQLVKNGSIIVFRPRVGMSPEKFFDEEEVKKEFSVTPNELACFLAFKGDRSDNIPGLRKFYTKCLAPLCLKYKTPKGVYRNLKKEKLTTYQRESLLKFEKQAHINFSLTKLRLDLSDIIEKEGKSDSTKLSEYFKKYEIRNFSSEEFVDLFNQNTSFLHREGPTLETVSLFD
jgi:DNA polymerase-1